ncbi:hypothetical protein VNO77_05062 [Canavalia gladiata]|uniref:NB-ARC domain-containing protein n=1 Tax=Canavalia gladiata TaxID=3824 RepID=A0AAN9MY92_CANGL
MLKEVKVFVGKGMNVVGFVVFRLTSLRAPAFQLVQLHSFSTDTITFSTHFPLQISMQGLHLASLDGPGLDNAVTGMPNWSETIQKGRRFVSCCKVHAAYACKLEENLKSFQEKWDHLQNFSSDVQTRINEAEVTGEMQTSEVKALNETHKEEGVTDCEGIVGCNSSHDLTSPWYGEREVLLFEKQIKAMELAGVIWEAVTCLFSCCKVHSAYVYKLEKNLSSLKEKCDLLQNLRSDLLTRINEAEATGEMQRTGEVKDWLQQVQNLQKELDDIQNKDSQETQNKCLRGCCPKNCLSSYKLGKKVVKMLDKVDELAANGKNVIIVHKLPPKPVEEMPLDETIGLNLMLNKVWSCLEDENVGIVGLYGMGGAGKTTLMKRIHNELGKRKHCFEVVLWVVVSKDLDTHKIMNDIRNRLGIKDEIWNGLSSDRRAAKIHEVLQKKKCVDVG